MNATGGVSETAVCTSLAMQLEEAKYADVRMALINTVATPIEALLYPGGRRLRRAKPAKAMFGEFTLTRARVLKIPRQQSDITHKNNSVSTKIKPNMWQTSDPCKPGSRHREVCLLAMLSFLAQIVG